MEPQQPLTNEEGENILNQTWDGGATITEYVESLDRPWTDKELMLYLYDDCGLVMVEMAALMDCCRYTISTWLDKFGATKPDEARRARSQFIGKPVSLSHNEHMYEGWRHSHGDQRWWVTVHRLAAVAWFGFDEVAENHVHHKNTIRWDNREDNLEVMSPSEHSRHHSLINNNLHK